MATYKQRIPAYRIPSGRYSPENNDPTTPGNSSQHAHHTAVQHQYYSAHQNLSSAYHNPDDDILDYASDQEWTSVRRSTDTQSRAAYRQRLLEQRIQDWHLVLDQHRQNPFYQSDSTSAEEDNVDPVSSTPTGNADASDIASPHSSLVTTSVTAATFSDVQPVTSPGAATHTSGSHFAFSDLASDSIGDESEDLELWSPDDDDTFSTASRHRHHRLHGGVASYSPTASQSSLASFGNLPHPSFYHGGHTSPALRFQNRMPFHDGSGNFVTHRRTSLHSRSHTGSEMDSDQGGWESTVSSSKALSATSSRRVKRGAATARALGAFSPGEFESMLESIASLQVQQQQQQQQQTTEQQSASQQSPMLCPYTFHPFARDGLAMRPRWPRSPSVAGNTSSGYTNRRTRPHQQYAPTPRRPSNLQRTIKSYDSDNEDLSQLVAAIPSKNGWLHTFEQTLQSLNVKHAPELNMNETSSTLNPIKVLAHHTLEEPSDLAGLAKTLVPEEALDCHQHTHEDELRSTNVTPTPSSIHMETTTEADITPKATPTPAALPGPLVDGDKLWDDDCEEPSGHDTTFFKAFISTLRRFRDHVKANLLYPELDEHYLSSLRFENSDLGIEWATGGGTPPPRLMNHPTTVDNGLNIVRSNSNLTAATDGTIKRAATVGTSRSGSRQTIRRTGSDCAIDRRSHGRRRVTQGNDSSGQVPHVRGPRMMHDDQVDMSPAPMFI
ncbi:hypothetical protein BGW42_007645 [Actinomortierella wolfii]|nr:hypothetical protein BGW42_007645 [Actinomortierella wolfii]